MGGMCVFFRGFHVHPRLASSFKIGCLRRIMGSMPKFFRTSDLARLAGIHVNTVRRYVDWGLLPPVERSPAGYRRFTQAHVDCLRVARLVYGGGYPGGVIRRSGVQIIYRMAAGDLGGARELAYQHLALVQAERAHAEAAASFLERWALGISADAASSGLQIGETARLLGVSRDVLRNWERNGLVDAPRAPNGYRRYGLKEIGRLRVVRMLSRAGYSQMAILRMLLQLQSDPSIDVRQALDTPREDEDVYTAADQWLSTLGEQEGRARQIIARLEELIQNANPSAA
jgi:DNA-binding transcriptional MerR regulator